MRVLITGATGFVGRHIVNAFIRKGAEVSCLVRTPGQEEMFGKRTVETFYGQVTDPKSLKHICHNLDVVVHLVATIREKGKLSFDFVNRQGTANIVAAAKEEGVNHFVHMSALGATPDQSYPYPYSKWQSEQEVMNSGISYTIVRPSVQFGGGDEFINTLSGLIRSLLVVPVAGSGQARFQPVSVEDVALWVVEAAAQPEYYGRTIDLGGPDILTYNEIIDLIRETYQVKRLKAHIPMPVMRQFVRIMEFALPHPPVTLKQLKQLNMDNVTKGNAIEKILGFKPRPLRGNIEYIKQIGFIDGIRIGLGMMPRRIRDH